MGIYTFSIRETQAELILSSLGVYWVPSVGFPFRDYNAGEHNSNDGGDGDDDNNNPYL